MLETVNGQYIVLGVSCLICILSVTTQCFVLIPALGVWSSKDTLQSLGPLNLGILLLSYYYYLAIVTDPGKVPADWEPPYSLIRAPDQVQTEKGETGPRYCRSCDAYKPPRAHHCRICRQCTLKMDHHCPWINNCVGHGNYPHFIRFVFFVSLTCGYALYLLVWRLLQIIDSNSLRNTLRPVTMTEMIFIVFDVVGVFVTVFSVSLLGLYHTYCMVKGQTTIEAWERSKVKALVRKRKIARVEYPYDLGPIKNISSVLGDNVLLWLFPRSSVGDGLSYSLRPDTDPTLPYYWPPRDPDELKPSIFDQQESEQQSHRHHPQLVRRDSEGYLVREISIEERMKMLNGINDEEGYDEEGYQGNSYDTYLEKIPSAKPVEDTYYYYDSGSDSDGNFMDDEYNHNNTQ